MGDLAREIAAALGSHLEPELTGECRAGDIRHCFADTGAAADVLGFRATITPAEGVLELADWVARQSFEERGDQAMAGLRRAGLIG